MKILIIYVIPTVIQSQEQNINVRKSTLLVGVFGFNSTVLNLKREAEGVQMVIHGKNTHFSRNNLELKSKIIRYKCREKKINAIAFESKFNFVRGIEIKLNRLLSFVSYAETRLNAIFDGYLYLVQRILKKKKIQTEIGMIIKIKDSVTKPKIQIFNQNDVDSKKSK